MFTIRLLVTGIPSGPLFLLRKVQAYTNEGGAGGRSFVLILPELIVVRGTRFITAGIIVLYTVSIPSSPEGAS